MPANGFAKVPNGIKLVSPEGLVHAVLAGCVKDLPNNKEQWRNILLSIPCAFQNVTAQGLWVKAWNARQALLQEFESLSRTAFQLAIELCLLKAPPSVSMMCIACRLTRV